jgi:hypothetical protein
MALIKCYECEKEISDKAPACPHCGSPSEMSPWKHYEYYDAEDGGGVRERWGEECSDGPYESFFKNGQLKSKGTYRGERRDGIWQDWRYADGDNGPVIHYAVNIYGENRGPHRPPPDRYHDYEDPCWGEGTALENERDCMWGNVAGMEYEGEWHLKPFGTDQETRWGNVEEVEYFDHRVGYWGNPCDPPSRCDGKVMRRVFTTDDETGKPTLWPLTDGRLYDLSWGWWSCLKSITCTIEEYDCDYVGRYQSDVRSTSAFGYENSDSRDPEDRVHYLRKREIQHFTPHLKGKDYHLEAVRSVEGEWDGLRESQRIQLVVDLGFAIDQYIQPDTRAPNGSSWSYINREEFLDDHQELCCVSERQYLKAVEAMLASGFIELAELDYEASAGLRDRFAWPLFSQGEESGKADLHSRLRYIPTVIEGELPLTDQLKTNVEFKSALLDERDMMRKYSLRKVKETYGPDGSLLSRIHLKTSEALLGKGYRQSSDEHHYDFYHRGLVSDIPDGPAQYGEVEKGTYKMGLRCGEWELYHHGRKWRETYDELSGELIRTEEYTPDGLPCTSHSRTIFILPPSEESVSSKAKVRPVSSRPSGYVYALTNTAMPGLVKVGQTTSTPQERAEKLSSATGVAAPFVVADSFMTHDPVMAETLVHQKLEEQGLRYSDQREFFADIDVVKEKMSEVKAQLAPPPIPRDNCPSPTRFYQYGSLDVHSAAFLKRGSFFHGCTLVIPIRPPLQAIGSWGHLSRDQIYRIALGHPIPRENCVEIDIPKGTEIGDQFCVRGAGIRDEDKVGDMYITISWDKYPPDPRVRKSSN